MGRLAGSSEPLRAELSLRPPSPARAPDCSGEPAAPIVTEGPPGQRILQQAGHRQSGIVTSRPAGACAPGVVTRPLPPPGLRYAGPIWGPEMLSRQASPLSRPLPCAGEGPGDPSAWRPRETVFPFWSELGARLRRAAPETLAARPPSQPTTSLFQASVLGSALTRSAL